MIARFVYLVLVFVAADCHAVDFPAGSLEQAVFQKVLEHNSKKDEPYTGERLHETMLHNFVRALASEGINKGIKKRDFMTCFDAIYRSVRGSVKGFERQKIKATSSNFRYKGKSYNLSRDWNFAYKFSKEFDAFQVARIQGTDRQLERAKKKLDRFVAKSRVKSILANEDISLDQKTELIVQERNRCNALIESYLNNQSMRISEFSKASSQNIALK